MDKPTMFCGATWVPERLLDLVGVALWMGSVAVVVSALSLAVGVAFWIRIRSRV